MQMKKTVLFLISVLFFGALRAQESPHTDTLGVKVYFRQGYSLLEPSYRDNGVRLAAFASHVESLQRDTLVRVKSIRVTGTASPDGTSRSNERLSENRAKNIIAWFEERFSFPGVSFDAHAEGIDWAGLTALVETSEMPYRDEVLNILYNTPEWIIRDGRVVDGRKRQLGLLRGGRAWWYMAEHFFPQLWSGGMHLSCEIERRIVPQPEPEPVSEPQPEHKPEPQPEPEVAEEPGCESVQIPDPVVGQTPAPEPAAEIAAQPSVPEGKPFYMSLKPICFTTRRWCPTSVRNSTWAAGGRSAAAGCMPGGRMTGVITIGASTAASSTCADTSAAAPLKSRLRDTMSAFTAKC